MPICRLGIYAECFAYNMERRVILIMESNDDLAVGGYRFATVADAETARLDAKRIKNLEDNLDYRKPQNVLLLYHKALENGIFQTPIGFAYLVEMQEHLKRCGIPEENIKPIPLNMTFTNKNGENSWVRRSIANRKPVSEYRGRFITSVLLNLIMIVAIIGMFAICLDSDSPNIVNYRRVIINEYSEWEQELTDRESELRKLERQYNVEP